jgi:hypothetical protein
VTIQRSHTIRGAAIAALALVAAVCVWATGPARAAPGLSTPVRLIHTTSSGPQGLVGQTLCFSVSGNAIAWTKIDSARYRDPKTKRELQITTGSRIEPFDASGPGQVQMIGPPNAFADCPAVDSRGSTTTAVSETEPPIVLTRSGLKGPAAIPGALYVATLGSPAVAIPGVAGAAPRVATLADGSAVVAWLALAPGSTGADPAFEVYAARRAADGTFSAPQLLSAAGSVDRQHGSAQLALAPDVVVDPDGSAEVAWSLLADQGKDSIVQVSQAPPGGPFGPPQTLAQPGTPSQGPVDVLRFASGGPGHHVVEFQREDKSTNVGLQMAAQDGTGGSYRAIQELYSSAVEIGPLASGLAMDDAGDLLDLVSPDATGVGLADDLEVLRKPVGSDNFGAGQFLVAQTHGQAPIIDSALAVAADGRAAAVWTQILPAPFDGITARVMLSTAPPGGRFGTPVAVTGFAPIADRVGVTYDGDGQLRIVWSAATSLLGDDDFFGAVQSPGTADPVSGPGPALAVVGVAARPRGITLTLRIGRPATVRVNAAVLGGGFRLSVGGETGRTFTRAGVVRVPVDLGAPVPHGRRLTANAVVYATDQRGASRAISVRRHFTR